MEITLQTIRETLRGAFGRESFVASFITRVETTENCATACIDAGGVMRCNPEFVRRHVTGPADLFCLVAHELMHPMFGHFIYQNGPLENLGADMVINAAVSLLYAKHSGSGSLFRRYYKPEGVEGLLRSGSDMNQSRYARLYHDFYMNPGGGRGLSTGEVIRALRVLTPGDEARRPVLLGGHGADAPGKGGGQSPVFQPDPDTAARIAGDLRRAAARPGGCAGGYADALYSLLVEVLRTRLALRRVLLEQFTTRRKVDRFRGMITQPRVGVSPIPLRPSKRDFVMLAAGVPPFHYHNNAWRPASQERGLAVYLDVSGSVNDHLPGIIGLLHSLRTELKTIYLFSNKVVEVPFRTLLAGHVKTTYGTDFDCIGEHALANRLDKAVILTDGHATMSRENQEQLKTRAFRALTVLFGGKTRCGEFAPFGDVVRLEDVAR